MRRLKLRNIETPRKIARHTLSIQRVNFLHSGAPTYLQKCLAANKTPLFAIQHSIRELSAHKNGNIDKYCITHLT